MSDEVLIQQREGGYWLVDASGVIPDADLAGAHEDYPNAENARLRYIWQQVELMPIYQEQLEKLKNLIGGHWKGIPQFPMDDWKDEIRNDDTRLGYVEWLYNKIDGWFNDDTPEPLNVVRDERWVLQALVRWVDDPDAYAGDLADVANTAKMILETMEDIPPLPDPATFTLIDWRDYAQQWGSFDCSGDPGVCMFMLTEGARPRNELHREKVLDWILHKCVPLVKSNPTDYAADELQKLMLLHAHVKKATLGAPQISKL